MVYGTFLIKQETTVSPKARCVVTPILKDAAAVALPTESICDEKDLKDDTPLLKEEAEKNNATLEEGKKDEEAELAEAMAKMLPYGLDAKPTAPLTILLAIQLTLVLVSVPLVIVYLLTKEVCGATDVVFTAELLSTHIYMCGVNTLLQLVLGVRLPMVVGSSFAYIPPVTAAMHSPRWRCPNATVTPNYTDPFPWFNPFRILPKIEDDGEKAWKPRVQAITGAMLIASGVHFLLGLTGLAGALMKCVGPLTIVTTLVLLSLSLTDSVAEEAQQQWGVAFGVVALVLFFTLVLGGMHLPFPIYRPKKGCSLGKYPVFRIFPGLLALSIGWLVCYILTVTNKLPTHKHEVGFEARTDAKLFVLSKASWFFFPYPGRFGMPTIDAGLIIGMIPAVFVGIVESIGIYYTVATAGSAPPPPSHAVSRGILVEGVSNVIGAFSGSSCGIGAYGSTIGYLSITGVASRRVWAVMCFMLMICGIIGKVGAALSIIPVPVVAGMTMVALGSLVSVGVSNIKHVNMKSSRNVMVLGVSVFVGLMFPAWMKPEKHASIINTGNDEADHAIRALLQNSMLLGGLLSIILDNIMPGSKEDRGMLAFEKGEKEKQLKEESGKATVETWYYGSYDLPLVTRYLLRCKVLAYVPFLPTYNRKKLSGQYSVN